MGKVKVHRFVPLQQRVFVLQQGQIVQFVAGTVDAEAFV